MMMNQSQMMSNQLQQIMNTHNSQLWMNHLINLSNMMTDQSLSQGRLNTRGGGHRFKFTNQNKNCKVKKSNGMRKNNNRNELQQHNRLKARHHFTKKRFNNGGKSAPFAPRNTTSFLIRAKKSGGITSLVSPSPVTPAVLRTPVFSPSPEVLVDTAKEEWGVDGYGSMNGLIRVRAHENDEDEEDGSIESHMEEQLEVERRLDHDLSRFEMIYPNYGVNDHNSCVLENRVDDQDTHIAQLEEENSMLKERLFIMERNFSNMRMKLQSLEVQRQGAQGLLEEVVENDSENDSASRGYGRVIEESTELLEESNVGSKQCNNGEKKLQGMEVLEGVNVGVADVHMNDSIEKIEENKDFVIEGNKIEDDHSNVVPAGFVNERLMDIGVMN